MSVGGCESSLHERDRLLEAKMNYGAVSAGGESKQTQSKQLRKELGLVHMTGFVIGEVIGSGIFISPYVALKHTGSAGLSLVVWAVGGAISLLGGLCYAELGTLLKKSGGEYTILLEGYSFRELRRPWLEALGALMAFLYAWTTCFILRPTSLAIVCLTFGSYLARPFYLECDIPPYVVQLLAMAAISKPCIELC